MKKIAIIDYGMGNLHSVKNALDHIGADSFISSDRNALASADAMILPGVGAFPDAMTALTNRGLCEFIREYKKPLLGICLGMQLLFNRGYEGAECEGLGLIAGSVVKIEAPSDMPRLKIPHMGWNELDIKKESRIMRGLSAPSVYFVHSYKALCDDRDDILATAEYGSEICAAVERGNVCGMQYHPEKSSDAGLLMLKNFCDTAETK